MQTEQNNKKIVLVGLLAILVIIGLFSLADFLKKEAIPQEALENPDNTGIVASEEARKTTYICENNFTTDVEFIDNRAILSTSDGRFFELNSVEVASGVKYANSDGTFIFWTKGPSATIEEGGVVTYSDCIEPKQ